MAHIEDRWHDKTTGEQTARYGSGKRWLLRWRDPDGTGRKLSYARKTDAQDKRKAIESDIQRGTYVDPREGRQTFDDFAAEWVSHRTSNQLTIENTQARLRRYVTGTPLGKTPLSKIRPSTVQAWLKSLTVADSTARVVFDHVSSILAAAVDDGVIARNPCLSKSVTPPKPSQKQIIPWTAERISALYAAMDNRYTAMIDLGAGVGLRAGEIFGLSPDDIDWLRGRVHVQRQVKIVGNRRVFDYPKGGKDRFVPLIERVKNALSVHLARHPASTVTLPWNDKVRTPTTVRLLVTNPRGEAIHGSTVGKDIWHPALDKAGIPRGNDNGMHALRHYYASALLDGGDSIKAVSRNLGHTDPGFTLRTYTHLMPDSEDRSRAAITKAFNKIDAAGDVGDSGARSD